MRTLLGLAAATGLACLSSGAMAAPLTVSPSSPSVQQAYYTCGPECQRHRYWAQRRAEHHAWHTQHYGYNGYYRGY